MPLEVLPEELRGLPENQIKFLLGKMVEGLQVSNTRTKQLEQELEGLKKRPAPGQSRPAGVAPEEGGAPAAPPKKLEEWILEDPEAALNYWAEKRFAGALSKLTDVEDRVGENEFMAVRSQFDDFGEVEEEVRQVLRDSGAPKTQGNIQSAYAMVVGMRAIADKKRGFRAANNAEAPAPEPVEGAKEYAKTQLSEEIRLASGLSEVDFYDTYNGSQPLNVKLPGVP